METDVTLSKSAAAKEGAAGTNKSSQAGAAVDHFELFAVGTKPNGNDAAKRKKTLPSTPSKRRKTTSFASPTKLSAMSADKPKTPRKTPIKKDVFSPVAKKLLDRAKGILTSPRKSATPRFNAGESLEPRHLTDKVSREAKTEERVSDAESRGEAKGDGSDRKKGLDRVRSSQTESKTSRGTSQASVTSSALQNDPNVSINTPKDKERESRSERNKKKLKEICLISLKDRGVGRNDAIFNGCFTRLYSISKSFVKDLKTSQNLREEMRKIVESHADLVVNFEKNRA